MADHPGTTPPPIPFITDVRLQATGSEFTLISYLDHTGKTAARSVVPTDLLDTLGRSLISLAFVSHVDGAEPRDITGTLNFNLMQNLSITPGGEAATLHAHPPLDRLNPTGSAVQP